MQIDGVELDRKGIGSATPVDPGVHALTLQALGRVDQRVSITLAEGEKKDWTLSPGARDAAYVPVATKAPEAGSLAPTPTVLPPEAPRGSSTKRTVGFVVGGVGIAGFALAGITGALVVGQNGTI